MIAPIFSLNLFVMSIFPQKIKKSAKEIQGFLSLLHQLPHNIQFFLLIHSSKVFLNNYSCATITPIFSWKPRFFRFFHWHTLDAITHKILWRSSTKRYLLENKKLGNELVKHFYTLSSILIIHITPHQYLMFLC